MDAHSNSQATPFQTQPGSHAHVKLPSVFSHTAVPAHEWLPAVHSSTSVHPSPTSRWHTTLYCLDGASASQSEGAAHEMMRACESSWYVKNKPSGTETSVPSLHRHEIGLASQGAHKPAFLLGCDDGQPSALRGARCGGVGVRGSACQRLEALVPEGCPADGRLAVAVATVALVADTLVAPDSVVAGGEGEGAAVVGLWRRTLIVVLTGRGISANDQHLSMQKHALHGTVIHRRGRADFDRN
eukprot:1801958-Rhodomonas_salina.1